MQTGTDNLAAGEEIIYKAGISWVAYSIACLMFLVLMATGQLSGLLTSELLITSKRVTGKRGLLWRKKINVLHRNIAYISLRQSISGRIFDYGTLKIVTKDDAVIRFKGIAEPWYVKQQIEEIIEIAVLGHSLSDYTAHRF